MISYFFLIFYLSYSYAFEPSCQTCKFFVPHKTNVDLSLCEVFKNRLNNDEIVKNFASHCRSDENLCGKSAFLYESKYTIMDKKLKEVEQLNELKRIEQEAKETAQAKETTQAKEIEEQLDNMCCGEVNEKFEIREYENMERELFDILQKLKKHNTKRIYKNSLELYKLFKRK